MSFCPDWKKVQKLLTHFRSGWERDKAQTDRERGKTINNMEGLIIANIKIKNRVTEKINKAKKIVGEQN